MQYKNDSTAKRYYWLKLKNDFFDQKEIKLLRKIAGGDTFTIIYLKMLLKSLQDNGSLYFEAIGDDFTEELALDLDEDVENVALTIQFLQAKKLLEIIEEDEFFLNRVPEMVGSEAYSTERSRRHRNKKKQKMLQCNANETEEQRNATKRIEQEQRKDLEKREKRGEQRAEKEQELESELDKETETKLEGELYASVAQSLSNHSQLTLTDCFSEFSNSFGRLVETERRIFRKLANEYSAEFLHEAISKAYWRKMNGTKIDVPVAYITSLLKQWNDKGFKSVEDIDIEQEEFNKEHYGDVLPF